MWFTAPDVAGAQGNVGIHGTGAVCGTNLADRSADGRLRSRRHPAPHAHGLAPLSHGRARHGRRDTGRAALFRAASCSHIASANDRSACSVLFRLLASPLGRDASALRVERPNNPQKSQGQHAERRLPDAAAATLPLFNLSASRGQFRLSSEPVLLGLVAVESCYNFARVCESLLGLPAQAGRGDRHQAGTSMAALHSNGDSENRCIA